MVRSAPWALLLLVFAGAVRPADRTAKRKVRRPARATAALPTPSPQAHPPHPQVAVPKRPEPRREWGECEPSAHAVATRREVVSFIAKLLELAFMAFDQRKFDSCIRLADEILLVDPHYNVAVELKEDVEKSRHREEYWRFIRKKVENWKALTDSDEECIIPYEETLRFPSRDEWKEVCVLLQSRSAPSSNSPLQALAAARTSFDLEKESPNRVLARLRVLSGVDIVSPMFDDRPYFPFAATDVSGLDALLVIAAREGLQCEFLKDAVRLTRADYLNSRP